MSPDLYSPILLAGSVGIVIISVFLWNTLRTWEKVRHVCFFGATFIPAVNNFSYVQNVYDLLIDLYIICILGIPVTLYGDFFSTHKIVRRNADE